MREKINKIFNDYGRDLLVMIVVLLVAVSSFGLGRMSVIERGSGNIRLLEANIAESQNSAVKTDVPVIKKGGQVVASKNGKKYYLPFCKSVSRISEANKIYFDSEESARAAGYTPAKNCAGLK